MSLWQNGCYTVCLSVVSLDKPLQICNMIRIPKSAYLSRDFKASSGIMRKQPNLFRQQLLSRCVHTSARPITITDTATLNLDLVLKAN